MTAELTDTTALISGAVEYERAIEIDSSFAAAYANISIVLQTGWSFLWPGYDTALDRALKVDSPDTKISSFYLTKPPIFTGRSRYHKKPGPRISTPLKALLY